MNTPMKLRLKSFQLVTRKAFSYAQSITWLGRVEAGVCKSDTSYIFLHLSKIMGTSIQHLKFLLFYGEFSFNEKNKAAMVLKAICPHKHKVFLTQYGAYNSFIFATVERTHLSKASVGSEKLY